MKLEGVSPVMELGVLAQLKDPGTSAGEMAQRGFRD